METEYCTSSVQMIHICKIITNKLHLSIIVTQYHMFWLLFTAHLQSAPIYTKRHKTRLSYGSIKLSIVQYNTSIILQY